MSALADSLRNTKPIAAGVRNRILILDVERLPGITQQTWWDRGDLKNRYVHHETVTREPTAGRAEKATVPVSMPRPSM